MEPTAERSYSKLEWVIYIVILPLIFISILTITLLWFLDFDVKSKLLGTLNNIPLIEKLIDDEKLTNVNIETTNSTEKLEFTIKELENTITEKDLSLVQTEKTLIAKDEEIKKLNQQIEELQAQLQEKNRSEQSRDQEIAELAKVYAAMSAKSAANILSELSYEEAALILGQMNTEAKSKILEKMDPKKAADISMQLKELAQPKETDVNILPE